MAAQQSSTQWYANALSNISGMLTPFSQNFTSASNAPIPDGVDANQSWVQASTNNGAGPTALNVTAPGSFNGFITGNRPASPVNPQGTGNAPAMQAAIGGPRFPMLIWVVVGLLIYVAFFKR